MSVSAVHGIGRCDTVYGVTAWNVSSGPGITALGLAAARSVETGRADRLIEDPFARALFEAAGADLSMCVDWPCPGRGISATEALHLHGSLYIGVRTRFYDDTVLDATSGGSRQIVLLGSGLDTRVFRLDLPADCHVFELDQAPVLEYKDAVLAALGAEPRCPWSAIGIDLRDDWPSALQAHGLQPKQSTIWIAEGVLPYLAPDAQVALIERIHRLAAPGSSLAFDRLLGDPHLPVRVESLSERSGIDMTALLAGGAAHDPGAFLHQNGWTVVRETPETLAQRYGRDLANPFPVPSGLSAEPPWLGTEFVIAGALPALSAG